MAKAKRSKTTGRFLKSGGGRKRATKRKGGRKRRRGAPAKRFGFF